ncbi:hypothetical protein E4T66_13505 [Sinimarinibacterium sp. CAU 1509]|uniref:hypothetical protein n=1 Tax=Sinimarinibacterium sp. CAU 1509 TaxID=2562283 RepID=UPI0010AC4182|nr:hypothetical protein [Sinimarinibacterium sp. CAU 1509]TJY59405.1 hypothetical protein E4T66_13505 [Sinimarinibacterium sp. CAU 1509]
MIGFRLLLPACMVALLLGACGGSQTSSEPGGSSSGGGSVTPVGDADTETWRALQSYLKVIKTSSDFDECFTNTPQTEPWQCARGPRTGTALGKAVHTWLMSEFRAIPELRALQTQEFELPIFKPVRYGLTVETADGVESIPAFPWYYRGITTRDGVTGALVDVGDGSLIPQLTSGDLSGKIAMMNISLTLNSEDGQAANQLAQLRAKGAIAAIVGTDAPGNEIATQNYDIADGLRALPTVIVGQQDLARLRAMEGNAATLTVAAGYLAGTNSVPASLIGQTGYSRNTIAVLPGADSNNIVVVGTPLNGWTSVGGERGPGVGMLVYLARYFAERARTEGPLPYTLWFVGTGAHEIYGFGLNRFLSCFDKDRIVAYVHLGSGLVYPGYTEPLLGDGHPTPTGGMSQTRTLAISENSMLQAITGPAFSDPVLQPYFTIPPSLFVPGENRGPYAQGIPTVGMNGANAYFHTMLDDDTQIFRAALGPMALAFRQTVDGLLNVDAAALRRANLLASTIGASMQDVARYWSCAGEISVP